ncbi:hypothetical protein MRX96_006766 [Rhipicephalus microplus]
MVTAAGQRGRPGNACTSTMRATRASRSAAALSVAPPLSWMNGLHGQQRLAAIGQPSRACQKGQVCPVQEPQELWSSARSPACLGASSGSRQTSSAGWDGCRPTPSFLSLTRC